MADAGRILIMPKGDYSPSVSYEMLDLVSHNNITWLAKKDVIGIEPSTANSEHWFKFTDEMTDAETLNGKSESELNVGNALKLNGLPSENFVAYKPSLYLNDLSHSNMPKEGGVMLTPASGLTGLPEDWGDSRHNLTRLYNGNIAYTLDLLASYGFQRLAWRIGKEWKEIIHTGNMNMIDGGNADTVDGYHASDFAKSEYFSALNNYTWMESKNTATNLAYRLQLHEGEVQYWESTDGGINWSKKATLNKNYLPFTGGKLTGALEISLDGNGKAQFFGNSATAFMTAVNSEGTINRQARVKASGDIASCMDIYDSINKVSYNVLHTGNSQKVTISSTAPTDGLWVVP